MPERTRVPTLAEPIRPHERIEVLDLLRGFAIFGILVGLDLRHDRPAYAAALVSWARRPRVRARLRPLAAVGRTALSNYLFQTLVATTLVHGDGLGLYGRAGPALGLVLTVAIFAVQLAASSWWVPRFRFGPFEWVWRSATYGRAQPMRVGTSRAG